MTNVKRLIILDLNGFLIHRVFKDEYAKSKHLLQQHYRLKNLDEPKRKGNFAVWLRPHTETFLPWLMDNFHVAIWSSVLRRNLEPIIEELFQRQHSRDRLLFFWDQEKCWTEENPDETDPKKRQSFYKRLSSVWDSAEIEERWLIGQPEDSDIKDHTLLIDDNKLKMASSNVQQTRTGEDLSINESNLNMNDDYLQDNTPLIIISEKPYRRIRTSPFIFFHILVTISLEIVIVGLPIICDIREKLKFCPIHSSYNIALYVHAGAYFINLLFDRIYHYYQDLSRRDGYLEFYRRTRNLRRTPLIIISAGNAVLVAMIKLLEDYSDKISPMKPEYCLAILTTVEMLIILVTLIWYFVLTIGFNKKRARPDATNEDFLSTFVPPTTSANEVGFRDETYREDVLTKQAELIRYLRERNVQLSRLLVQIQNPNNPTNVIHRRV